MAAVAVFIALVGVGRAAAVWLLAHLFLWVVAGGEVAPLPIRDLLVLGAAAGAASLFFSRRQNELIFLANLGVPWQAVAVPPVAAIIAFEVILRLIHSMSAA